MHSHKSGERPKRAAAVTRDSASRGQPWINITINILTKKYPESLKIFEICAQYRVMKLLILKCGKLKPLKSFLISLNKSLFIFYSIAKKHTVELICKVRIR